MNFIEDFSFIELEVVIICVDFYFNDDVLE